MVALQQVLLGAGWSMELTSSLTESFSTFDYNRTSGPCIVELLFIYGLDLSDDFLVFSIYLENLIHSTIANAVIF